MKLQILSLLAHLSLTSAKKSRPSPEHFESACWEPCNNPGAKKCSFNYLFTCNLMVNNGTCWGLEGDKHAYWCNFGCVQEKDDGKAHCLREGEGFPDDLYIPGWNDQ